MGLSGPGGGELVPATELSLGPDVIASEIAGDLSSNPSKWLRVATIIAAIMHAMAPKNPHTTDLPIVLK